MPRKIRLAVLVAVVVVAVPAAAAKAVARMPIGFYDDPSFRWSAQATTNLDQTQEPLIRIDLLLGDGYPCLKPANLKVSIRRVRNDGDSRAGVVSIGGLKFILSRARLPPQSSENIQLPTRGPAQREVALVPRKAGDLPLNLT